MIGLCFKMNKVLCQETEEVVSPCMVDMVVEEKLAEIFEFPMTFLPMRLLRV